MTQLALSNVINISVSQTPTGVSAFNSSNLALFTGDTPSPSFASGYKIYLDPTTVGVDFGTSSSTYLQALTIFSQNPSILLPGGYLVIIPYLSSETLAAAISRTSDTVQYFGVMSNAIESQVDMLAAAAVIQALNKIAFFVQTSGGSIAPAGSLDLLRSGGFTQSRGLFYSGATADALSFQAGYASRGLSTVFSGSNTTSTMNLKTLAGVPVDSGITQSQVNQAATAGVDIYPSLQGFSGVLSEGANSYFDAVYNLQWLASALQIAGFNYLASATTKIPQTEGGMDGLKGAYRAVMQQAVANGYLAPGTWNSATTFGNPVDLVTNVAQFGYYIYSSPIATQLQTDRAARKAPLIQIAAKAAGAIQSSTVVVTVNA